MNKYILVLFSILLVLTKEDPDTEIYKCTDDLKVNKACYLSDDSETGGKTTRTYYVNGCSKGEYCDVDNSGFCQKREKNYKLKTDEECLISEECISEICQNGKCIVLPADSECNDDSNCGPFAECPYNDGNSPRKCVTFALLGESCETKECFEAFACGEGNKCVKKYTQDTGKETKEDSACKSGFSATLDGKNVCVDVAKETDNCANSGKCHVKVSAGTSSDVIEDEELCTSKSDGTKVCKNLLGSEEWNNFVDKYTSKDKDLKNEDYAEMTNVEILDDNSVAEAYVEYMFGIQIGDQDCIRDYYMTFYRNDGSFYYFSKFLVLLFAFLI